jgi:predicted CoA-binding protein
MSTINGGRVTTSYDDLGDIYRDAETIAVVGASGSPSKLANSIPGYLQDHGYRMLPVNPRGGEILGMPAHRRLGDIEGPIDVVDVFRPPAEAETVAREAVESGAKVLWFQPGTHTDEAVSIATDAGLLVVVNRCIGAAHAQLGLGPGPERSEAR